MSYDQSAYQEGYDTHRTSFRNEDAIVDHVSDLEKETEMQGSRKETERHAAKIPLL